MTRWGMAIDLRKCIGCYSCAMSCKMKNGTPKDVLWAKCLEYETGVFPNARRHFLPILCNHCEDPACLAVCPSGATSQREDGIVEIDYDKCIGCRYCMQACPYDARAFMERIDHYFPARLTPFEEVKYKKWQTGVVSKCEFCSDRVERGEEPMCVVTCPVEARVFGDLDDPDSEVNQTRRSGSEKRLREEAKTNPCVFYVE